MSVFSHKKCVVAAQNCFELVKSSISGFFAGVTAKGAV